MTLVDQVKSGMEQEIVAVRENHPHIFELREIVSRLNKELATLNQDKKMLETQLNFCKKDIEEALKKNIDTENDLANLKI